MPGQALRAPLELFTLSKEGNQNQKAPIRSKLTTTGFGAQDWILHCSAVELRGRPRQSTPTSAPSVLGARIPMFQGKWDLKQDKDRQN